MPKDVTSSPPAGPAGRPARGSAIQAPRRHVRDSAWTRWQPHLRIALPVIALLGIVLFLLWPLFAERQGGLRLGEAPMTASGEAYMRMTNPQFSGIDRKNQPYKITAESGVQQTADESVLDLQAPVADIAQNNGHWVALTASTGRYDRTQNLLDLAGKVTVYHDDGYEVTTSQAHVDLKGGTADGDEPVAGQGPRGTIVSEGFKLLDRGDTVVFTGKARLLLEDSMPAPSDDAGARATQ